MAKKYVADLTVFRAQDVRKMGAFLETALASSATGGASPVSLRGEQAGSQIIYGKRQGDRAEPAAAVSRSVRRRKCGVQAFRKV